MVRPATETGTGAALRALRLAAGLTIERTAHLAGISPSYLSRAESGDVQPKPKWVAHVAEVIGDQLAQDRKAAS